MTAWMISILSLASPSILSLSSFLLFSLYSSLLSVSFLVSEQAILGLWIPARRHRYYHISQYASNRWCSTADATDHGWFAEPNPRLGSQGQISALERSHTQLKELITGLSMQVKQLSNRAPDVGPSGGNSLTRLSRVDFPKFEGDDVQGWIYRSEQFFELDAIAENKKITIAAIHLTGRALVWH